MKKHLLLILALLAFVLPARAQSEPDMLYNFKNNSTASTYGTTFGTSVDIDNVIANVTGVDVTDYGANAKNYVSAITEATNVAYNSKGGVYMKAGGKLTFTLKKGYKVTGYQFMGQQVDGTTATITLNGINFDGPTETQASGQYSRLYPVPSEVKTVNSITISSNKNVYIKSVGIYIEAEASDLTVNVAPPAGTYNVGQVVMASANNTSANVQMIISKIEGDNYTEISKTTTTGYNSYTFSEAGKYQVIAQAYTGNWQTTSNYFCEEYTIVGTSTTATLSVNLKTGSYKLPQTVTVTSSKTDDDIIVILTDENDQEVVNGTFKGSWNQTFTTPGTFALEALNGDGATISEIYELGYAPEAPVFSKANGAYTNGTEVTISSKYATKLTVKTIKKADYDANGFNATGTQTIYDADSHTLTLTEDVVIVAQGKNDFGTTSTDYRIYTISNPVKPNVAPVITFSHEDQKVFGSEEEIDVTLSLNHDVYPVPEVIYYTLDGFMAHNTLETGKPGATPAGHVLEAAVDPTSLSTVVRIERSHREALNHRAVTINAYAFNTAGNDVAAATYIFNDNASAQTAQYVAAPKTAANSKTYTAENVNAKQTDDYTFTISNYDSSKKYYKFQQNNTMTIAAPTGANMSKIEIAWSNKGSNARTIKVTEDGKTGSDISIANTVSSGTITWEGSANTVVLKHNGGTQFFFKSFTITADAGLDAVATPTITGAEEGAIYNEDVTVTVSCETEGASITLTDNGTAVTLNNGQYTVTSFTKHTLVAKATKEGMSDSKEATLSFTIKDPNAQTVQYVKATEVKEGDEIIILSKGSNNNWYVMKTSTSGNPPAIAAPTGFDGQIIDDDDNYQKFTVVKEGDKFYLMNGTKYLYNSGSGTGLQANSTTKAAIVFFPTDKTNTSDIKVNSRYVRMYNNNDFRAYTDNNNGTYAYIFKKYTPTTPTVDTPEITLSTQAKPSDPVTVTIDCATEGATVTYTVKKDGTTVADNLTYDPASKPVFSEVGSYTVNATASKEGMNPANAAPANFIIEKLVEVVEELFFVMDQNLWDVDGAYPETVVPFVYDRENGWYDLDIASIPATGWRQTAEGWFEINGGFRGNFYVRDGKANRKGLVFGAAGTVANTTYATRAAADGNQLVEPGVEYNMYIAGEGDTHKVFTTIGDETNSKAFSAGTIRVTHTPGNKNAAKPMTLQILANSDQTTGVDSITAEDAASDADARFFNLQGVEVPADRLAPGIYIRQAGSKATKVLVK